MRKMHRAFALPVLEHDMVSSLRALSLISCLHFAMYPSAVGMAECQSPLQEDDHISPNHIQTGRIELLSRDQHCDYEKATFSFEFGVRDDPERKITRNDWDLLFGKDDVFSVCMVTDDRSSIVDLGLSDFSEIKAIPLDGEPCNIVPAVEGHLYVVHTVDSQSNCFAVFKVVDIVPGDRCRIEWASFALDPPTAINRLGLDTEVRRHLAIVLNEATEHAAQVQAETRRKQAEARRMLEMREPRIVLQVRTGAGGGNPNRIDMRGGTSIYVDRVSEEPLDFEPPITTNDDAVAYWYGGFIPAGMVFAITSIQYEGTCKGDSNGHGAFKLVAGSTVIEERHDCAEPISGDWQGRIEVMAGAEASVYLEVANSSSGNVVFWGQFVDASAPH